MEGERGGQRDYNHEPMITKHYNHKGHFFSRGAAVPASERRKAIRKSGGLHSTCASYLQDTLPENGFKPIWFMTRAISFSFCSLYSLKRAADNSQP
jgi:hypothetical protein